MGLSFDPNYRSSYSTSDSKGSITDYVWDVLTIAGAVMEITAGVALLMVPEPTMLTKVAGAGLIAKGFADIGFAGTRAGVRLTGGDASEMSGALSESVAGLVTDDPLTRMIIAVGLELATASAGSAAARSAGTAGKAISIIGTRDTYRQTAKKLGANYLDVDEATWSWVKNEEFLKGVVSRGDDVVFSAGKFKPNKLKPSVLQDEINYLKAHGYEWNSKLTKLIKKR